MFSVTLDLSHTSADSLGITDASSLLDSVNSNSVPKLAGASPRARAKLLLLSFS